MGALPASTRSSAGNGASSGKNGDRAGVLDPSVDFERYREAACKRFISMARTLGHHAFHDLDELAKDFYDDFWAEWLERPHRELTGAAVPYIAGAMMNKLRDLSRRERSIRAPELIRSDSDAILATIATEELEPSEQVVLQEEMWLVSEIVHTLPAREQVAFAAVFGRDSKKKGTPPAGYKLAASQLGVTEARAKKLSLAANRRIRAAVEKIESGSWCERWKNSIELVAAGEQGEAEFLRHAEHCAQCRLGIAHLRRQAALLPLPVTPLAEHAGLLPRLWDHVRDGARAAREQLIGLFGRHASAANDASGLVSSSGGAAGAGVTAIKVGAVCLGVAATGGAASVCLQAVGVPSPIIAAVSGGHHIRNHRRTPRHAAHIQLARASTPPIIPLSTTTGTNITSGRAASSSRTQHRATSRSRAPTASAAQTEFNPGGGSGSQVSSGGGSTTTVSADTARSTTAPTTTSATPSKSATSSGKSSGGGGTVTSGSTNDFTAP